MSDQRAWYQDGWTIITLIVLAFLFGKPLLTAYQKAQQSAVPAQFRVKLVPGVLTGPKFEVFVWHQTPGDLRNGSIRLEVISTMLAVRRQPAIQQYSYEIWKPNEENGRRFEFPLTEFDPNAVIRFSLTLTAANALTTSNEFGWKDGQFVDDPLVTAD